MAIENIRRLMVKVSQKRHIVGRKEDCISLLMTTEQAYISKEKGELQHRVWNLGRQKNTTTTWQQYDKAID